MNTKFFNGLWMLLATCTACQQSDNESLVNNSLQMSIVASIGNQDNAPQSRYAGNDPSDVSFVEKDEIGLFIDDAPAVKWVYGSNGWASDHIVYWPDKTESHSFKAFYPYSECSSVEAVPMPSLLGQTGTIASISKCDFLFASVSQEYGMDGVVNFQTENSFKHVSSLVQLTVKGDGDLSESTITKIAIKGTDIVAPSTFSFADESVTLEESEESDVLNVDLAHEMGGNDAVFYLIVNEIKEESDAVITLSIEYSTGEKTYVAELENFANNVFTGGMCHRITVTIKDSALIISGSSISPWTEGESLGDVVVNGTETTE